MAKKIINIGNSANDGTGDNLRVAGNKINENFTELYQTVGLSITDVSAGPGIDVLRNNVDQVVISNTFTFPKYTLLQRDSLESEQGMVIFNTTSSKLQVYTGTQWEDLH